MLAIVPAIRKQRIDEPLTLAKFRVFEKLRQLFRGREQAPQIEIDAPRKDRIGHDWWSLLTAPERILRHKAVDGILRAGDYVWNHRLSRRQGRLPGCCRRNGCIPLSALIDPGSQNG